MSIGEKKLAGSGVDVMWVFSDDEIIIKTLDGMEIRDVDSENRPGIYKIDGDVLQMSFSIFGNPRPVNFVDGKPMLPNRINDPNI